MSRDRRSKIVPLRRGPLVMVVDDEPAPRAILGRMVRTLGYAVRTCSSGIQALRFMETHPRLVRLLLVDLLMPGMDGGELAERALDLDPSLQVLLVVGPHAGPAAELLHGYRDLPCLAKPVALVELETHLLELLGRDARTPDYPPSMGPPRPRRRRSGQYHP